MTAPHSTLNGTNALQDPAINGSTSYSRLKHSTGAASPSPDDDDQDDPEGWDTANEDMVEGDGGPDEEEEAAEQISPEERERRRRLKGKAVEVASDGEEDLPPNSNGTTAANHHQNPHQRANGRPHPRHFSTPPPLTSSALQGSSAASSAPIVNGNRDHPALPPPRPPGGGPGITRSHSTPYNEDAEAQMLSVPEIPSVNVIPNSPPPNGRVVDPSRTGAGSLDIPHTLTESSSQESLRRRETLGAASAAERRNNNRRSFDPRRGSNRLSGFFSNLLHLRDRSEPAASSEPPIPATPSPPASTAAPRPSSSRSNVTQPGSLQPLKPLQPPSSESLQPVERPPTPPPSLPPPNLRELGLQMTAITPTLTAPHFPSLPVSGVFLAPYYLLLCHNQGLDVMPLNGSLPPQPYALIRRVAFKSVLIMEERGVLVAIAGRREGVRVYSLDEVRKAVEWRIHAEMEKERERIDGMGGEWEHVQKAFFGPSWPVQPEDGKEDSPVSSGLPSKLSIDGSYDGPRLRGVSAPFVPTQPMQPAQEVGPSPRPRRSSLPPSPPPPYLSLTPTASEPTSEPTSTNAATPTASSQFPPHPSSFPASPDALAVPEEAAGPSSRTRNPSISTVAPPTPAHTVVPPAANEEEEPANEKGKGVDRTGGPLADDEKELERTVDSDDEALDPVAAGPSASAALDERTSAMAAASAAANAETMVVSPVESTDQIPSIRRPSVSASLASRRPTRPSNLDLSPSALGAPSANLPVVASPAPTLRSMRQALSHSDTVRRPVLAPRSPRASTSLSLSGVEDGTPDSPAEVGEDFISFAQALAESRLPSIPPLSSGQNPQRSSSMPLVVKPAVPASSIISALAASRNSMSSSQPDFAMSARLSNTPIPTPPPVPPIPTETPQAAKKRRRFSMVPFGKASSSASGGNSKNNRTPMMQLAAASASTPNLMEPAPSSAHNGGFSPPALPTPFSGRAEPFPPPSAPPSVGRSQSNSSLVPGDGASSSGPARRSLMPSNTVDRIFGPQTAPSSPMKTSRSATSFQSTGSGNANSAPSPPSPRSSRRFLPKLFTGFKKHHEARNSKDLNGRQRSEAEKRLAAGGAASAAAMSAPMLGNAGSTVAPGRVNDAATMHMTIVQAPPPKLEYVKLPGTKGAITIKAVETAKKSFLAILCGEAGEKIELFAGTYRTALGLSRTFILPDSPRSLELQLQGDDLVELFLVFAQNVFALEPATVRVREVRINRAERRAARRRAREARNHLSADNPEAAPTPEELPPPETIVTSVVTVGTDPTPRNRLSTAPIPGASTSPSVIADFNNGPPTSPLPNADGTANDPATAAAAPIGAHLPTGTTPEELAALTAVAQFGPYTTFQQLSYAPAFPLGTIADDYIIPPTYPDFLDYREHHEPDALSISELLAAPNTAPTLGRTPPAPLPAPVPSQPSPPPKWFYVDPKGVIQGPWKSTLMQSWFDDGFLPPDLPVRRDTETEYTPLKVLCAAAKHPGLPFRPPTPPPSPPPPEPLPVPNVLLHPISILAQPRRFGPPALFYTSRGGHSTSIVDSKGKSVLRGRINWTADDEVTRLGDVKRLEAFDTRGRAVLLALRHGGIEVADVGDALCLPGDESRPVLPHFHAEAPSVSRRPPFTWKLGSQFNAAGQTVSSSDLPSTISIRENPKRSTLLSGKKLSTGPAASSRPASRSDGTGGDDPDGLLDEEVLYLGRHRDVVYFCERNAGSFRIISLGTLES